MLLIVHGHFCPSIVHEQSCPSEWTACLYKMKQLHFCRSLTLTNDANTIILVFFWSKTLDKSKPKPKKPQFSEQPVSYQVYPGETRY